MDKNIIKKIASYGDVYTKRLLNPFFKKDTLLKNWWEGIQLLLHFSFYQGRRDDVSEKVEEKAMLILKLYFKGTNEDELIKQSQNNFIEINEKLKDVIGKGKIGKGRDIQMVISILDFVSKLNEKNLAKYSISKINNSEVRKHYEELMEIIGIGPKIVSLYLRDLIYLFSLDNSITKEDLELLQPIDTWVRQLSIKIGLVENNANDELIRKKIVEACLNANVSNIKFNQGLWYIGSNAVDILLENLEKI